MSQPELQICNLNQYNSLGKMNNPYGHVGESVNKEGNSALPKTGNEATNLAEAEWRPEESTIGTAIRDLERCIG